MARLIITHGPLLGRRYEIDHDFTIGGRDATVSIHDDAVSPRHAALWMAGDRLRVADVGSRDGTWVDGERIDHPVVLEDGSTLRIGRTTFVVEIDAPTGRDQTQANLAAPSFGALADAARGAEPAPYAPPPVARRRRADTRMWVPAVATFATIIATAVALVVYFALR